MPKKGYKQTAESVAKRAKSISAVHAATGAAKRAKITLPFCGCGCGNQLVWIPYTDKRTGKTTYSKPVKFLKGHGGLSRGAGLKQRTYKKLKNLIEAHPLTLCACGCGKMVTRSHHTHLPYKFLHGHRSPELKNRVAKSIKKSWNPTTTKHLAYRWTIVSPTGIRYITTNLQQWCQDNVALFYDHRPFSKKPLWKRARAGLGQLTTGNYSGCSWYGWTVAQKESINRRSGTPGPDLLGRDEAAMLL